jgi:hypothetical protein
MGNKEMEKSEKRSRAWTEMQAAPKGPLSFSGAQKPLVGKKVK